LSTNRISLLLNNIVPLAGILLIVILLTSGCGPRPPRGNPVGEAFVNTVEVRPGGEFSNEEFEIFIHGTFVHPCTRIEEINQSLEGFELHVDIITKRAPDDDENCGQTDEIVDFIRVLPLDASCLRKGTYELVLANMTKRFEIDGSHFNRSMCNV